MNAAGYNKAVQRAKEEVKQNAPRYPTVYSISPLKIMMPYSNTPVESKKFKHVTVSIGDLVSVRIYNGTYLIEGVIE